MKIISFDVGIKNMALCVFSATLGTESVVQINHWDILNVGAEPATQNISLCSSCKHNAAYQHPMPPRFFCKRHAKTEILPIPKINQLTTEELTTLWSKKWTNRAPPTTKKQLLADIKQEMLQKIQKTKAPNTTEMSLIDIGRKLTIELDKILLIHPDITHVLIENQISPIATRMKTIQGMLAQYFILRIPTAHIEFVSSHNKLTVMPIQEKKVGLSASDKYKENKRQSVERVAELVQGGPFADFFESSKKKDDLADCLLQGIWFVQVKK